MAKPRRNSRAIRVSLPLLLRLHSVRTPHALCRSNQHRSLRACCSCTALSLWDPPPSPLFTNHTPSQGVGIQPNASMCTLQHATSEHSGTRVTQNADAVSVHCRVGMHAKHFAFWSFCEPSLNQWPALYLCMHVVQDLDTRRFLLLMSLLSVEGG